MELNTNQKLKVHIHQLHRLKLLTLKVVTVKVDILVIFNKAQVGMDTGTKLSCSKKKRQIRALVGGTITET